MRLAVSWPHRRSATFVSGGLWLRLRAWTIPVALVLLAIFLRTYNFEPGGWIPDTYERLFDAERLARGEAPASEIYPPGFAVLIAPFFLFLPATTATIHSVIIASGVALVVLSYAWVLRITGQLSAGGLLAFVAAACPAFVFASRDGFLDMLNVLLIVSLFYFLPTPRSRGGLGPFVAYGAMLAVLVNVRATNVVLLPALAVLWIDAQGERFEVRHLAGTLLAKPLLVTLGTFTLLCVTSVLVGEWFGSAQGVPLDSSRFTSNLVFYYSKLTYGPLGIFILPLAGVGLVRLWQTNRAHAVALGYVMVIWPIAHSPFDFATLRYMFPPLFVIFLLAAIGASSLLKPAVATRRKWTKALVHVSLLLIAMEFAVGSALIIDSGPRIASESDGGMAREFQTTVTEFEDDSLLVSAVARTFRDSPASIEFLDLVDQHRNWGTDDGSLALVNSAIEEHLASGSRVYYLYSHWEAGHDYLGKDGRQEFDRFFEGIDREFRLVRLETSTGRRSGLNPWILYEVTTKDGTR